ncbi:hypothetical protein L0664_12610 [Octadecabacter sp. G9-8]|uniref:Flp pilus assembly protein TadG n=1 Tax=Octadecabacter dasysiphoniae TaxID=2909341 RepID=A0ABS9CYK9_9RHOB|nr:hypothetical protein [Octadecabacter dasysiphoniae]MCF2871912.1 hypothetical protein [Octadecabacter dasysiphoniae]
MLTYLKTKLRRFRREEDGSIIAEAVIMLPTLFAAVLATFVFFDAYRNQAINLKANYTISDAFSRESDMINNTYMINSWTLHRFLTSSPNLTRLRVSVIQYTTEDDTYRVVWSRAKGGGSDVDWGELSEIGIDRDEIPVMPDLERLIVVQTSVDYVPKFTIGLGDFTFEDMIFTRPRIGQGLCYSHNSTYAGRICPIGS